MNIKKIALVGCNGFIGSHLLRSFIENGVEVHGWDLNDHRIKEWIKNPLFIFNQEDVSDLKVVEKIAAFDVVIHLAAICTPSLYNTQDWEVIQSNYIWPVRLAEACAKNNSWFIYFSTSEVYGKTIRSAANEMSSCNSTSTYISDELLEDKSQFVYGPINARRWSYANAKQLMERSLIGLEAEFGLEWTVIRPFNFLGPGMDFMPGIDGEGTPRVLANFISAILKKSPMQIVDQGKAQRCFTAIDDAVSCINLIIDNKEKSLRQCFNIGNPNNEISIFDLAKMLTEIATKNGIQITSPSYKMISALELYGEGYEDSDRRLPNIDKARNLLNWNPKISLEQVLTDSLIWYKNHYAM